MARVPRRQPDASAPRRAADPAHVPGHRRRLHARTRHPGRSGTVFRRTVQRALQRAHGLDLVAWAERRIRAGWRWHGPEHYRLAVPHRRCGRSGAGPAPLRTAWAGKGECSKKKALGVMLREAAGLAGPAGAAACGVRARRVKGGATVLVVKRDLIAGLSRRRGGRVKAGAIAPPPLAASALTRPPRREVGLGSVRRCAMLSLLPCLSVPHDRVEDGQQLAGDGDEGDDLGLSGGEQPVGTP